MKIAFEILKSCCVQGLDGEPPVQLRHERARDSHGVASPDGKRIIFNSERVGWWTIWAMTTGMRQ